MSKSTIIVLLVLVAAGSFAYSTMMLRIGEQDFFHGTRDCITNDQTPDSLKSCVQSKAAKHNIQIKPEQIQVNYSEPFNTQNIGGTILVQKKTVTITAPFTMKRGLRSRSGTLKMEGDVLHQSKVLAPSDASRLKLAE